MHKYRFVPTSIWLDDTFYNMSPEHKLIFLYLMTCPYTSTCGIFNPVLTNMGNFIGYTEGPIENAWNSFLNHYKDWVMYDADTKEVAILYWPKFALVNAHKKAMIWAQNDLQEVQSPELLKAVIKRNSSTLSKMYLFRLRQLQAEALNERKKMNELNDLEGHGDVLQLTEDQEGYLPNTNTNTNTNTNYSIVQVSKKEKKEKNANNEEVENSSYRQTNLDSEEENKSCAKSEQLPFGVLGPDSPLPYTLSDVKRDLEAYFSEEENKKNALKLAGRLDLDPDQIDKVVEKLVNWFGRNNKRLYSWGELREWITLKWIREWTPENLPTTFEKSILPEDTPDKFAMGNFFTGMAKYIGTKPRLSKLDGIHGKQWLKLISKADNKRKREWLMEAVKNVAEKKKYTWTYNSLLRCIEDAYADVLDEQGVKRS